MKTLVTDVMYFHGRYLEKTEIQRKKITLVKNKE